MLVVKIELWPGGAPTRAREIGRVFIRNESNLADTSDYSVDLEEQGNEYLGIPSISRRVSVKGHERKQSVFKLLAKVFGLVSDEKKSS